MSWNVVFDCLAVLLVAAIALSLWSALAKPRAEAAWRSLRCPSKGARFHPRMVAGLPEPARRYFLHTIQPGTTLASSVELQIIGSIRLSRNGKWIPLRAAEMLSPPRGFVFTAAAGVWTRIVGHDTYLAPAGTAQWKLLGLFPVMRARGVDVSRSARGRMAGEFIFLPAALLPQNGIEWSSTSPETAVASFDLEGEAYQLLLTIAPDGAVRKVSVNRWGNVETEHRMYREIAFGATLSRERRFGGYTIPTRLNAGWRPDSVNYFEYFRIDELSATFQ